MASIIANLPPPTLVGGASTPLPKAFFTPAGCSLLPGYVWCGSAEIGDNGNRWIHAELGRSCQKKRANVVMKAVGESSESSTSLNIVESVQNIWDKSEDRVAVIGLGFAAVVGLWTSANLVSAIDKLPVLPGLFELIGILFSSWFVYRYLLFKPDRAELLQNVNRSISDVLGQ